MKTERTSFDIGQSEGPVAAPLCDHAGCTAEGVYRAPKARDRLNEYYHFCLDHVRDYNRTWDYYRGMSPEQIEREIRRDTVWQRPTWPLGGWSQERRADPFAAVKDGFGLFGRGRRRAKAEAPHRPRTAEEKALSILGLKPPLSFAAIKARYRELVKRLHPDANGGDKEAEEQLKVVNQAYSTLKQGSQSPEA